MSVFPGPFNPIVYAQFNLQGRWRRVLTYTFIYVVLIGGAIWLSTINGEPAQYVESIKGWLGGLLALQVLDLMLLGGFRVESAVRGEINSRMIESHRLMPAPPLGGVLGYIFGPTLQIFLIAAANFFLGVACCVLANVPLHAWALVNATLLVFALFVYSIIMQHALLARGGFVILIMVVVMTLISGANGAQTQSICSIAVLTSPLLGHSTVFAGLFNGGSMSADASLACLCSFIGQLIIAGICIRVAIRRYTTANAIGLSPALGLLLLATWVGLSVVDFSSPETFSSFGRYRSLPLSSDQVVTAYISSMLLALFPIASAAMTSNAIRRSGQSGVLKNNFGVAATTIIAGVIICCLQINAPDRQSRIIHQLMQIILVLIPFLAGTACVFCWGYLARNRAWAFAVIWVALTWISPMVVDAVHRAMTDNPHEDAEIYAISPPGAIAQIWSVDPVRLLPAIGGQIALAIFPVAGFIFTWNKRVRKLRVVSAGKTGDTIAGFTEVRQ